MNKFIMMLCLMTVGITSLAIAQERDTTCVRTVLIERVREDVQQKERRIEDLQALRVNLKTQIATLQQLQTQDSLLLDIKDRRLDIHREQIELKDKRIDELNLRLQKADRRKWLYYVGGVGTVVLSSIVLDKTVNNN